MDKIKKARPMIERLCFPESPRWHNGKLYFVDMYQGQIFVADVLTNTPDNKELLVQWPNYVSGLGWLPNGDLLFVDMQAQQVMRRDASGDIALHADLSALANGLCNDMVVDPNGNAYVSSFGYDIQAGEAFKKTPLIFVSAQGKATFCSPELAFPNGIVISADLTQVIIAETAAQRLVSFKRAADGSLDDRQTLFKFEQAWPDGICMDRRGNVWVAPVQVPEVMCINQAGDVVDRVATGGQPIACILGGGGDPTLYIATAPHGAPAVSGVEDFYRNKRAGCIETVKVAVGSAGFP